MNRKRVEIFLLLWLQVIVGLVVLGGVVGSVGWMTGSFIKGVAVGYGGFILGILVYVTWKYAGIDMGEKP